MLGIPHHGMVLESSVFRMGSFYAANWISSNLKGSTKQFGWLQASATKVSSLSITSANPATIRICKDSFQALTRAVVAKKSYPQALGWPSPFLPRKRLNKIRGALQPAL